MQDLSRLGIPLGVVDFRLRARQKRQYVLGDVRRQPQTFECGHDPIAPECRVGPGNSRIGVQPCRRRREQHVEVRRGAADPGIQALVRGVDVATEAFAVGKDPLASQQRCFVRKRVDATGATLASERQREHLLCVTLELDGKLKLRGRDRARGWFAGNDRASHDPVESFVTQLGEVRPRSSLELSAPPEPVAATDFEHVLEVRCKLDAQTDLERCAREVTDVDPLVTGAVPDEFLAVDVQAAAREDQLVVDVDVGIGQIHAEHQIVAAHPRAEHQRLPAGQFQGEPRKMAGARVVQALLVTGICGHVSRLVEEAKRVVLLEDDGPLRHRDLGRQDRKLMGCCAHLPVRLGQMAKL